MNSDHCTARYCRNPVWIIHLGKPLCQKHWEEYCDNERKVTTGSIQHLGEAKEIEKMLDEEE